MNHITDKKLAIMEKELAEKHDVLIMLARLIVKQSKNGRVRSDILEMSQRRRECEK